MNSTKITLTMCAALLAVNVLCVSTAKAQKVALKTVEDSVSYIMGHDIGQSLKGIGYAFDTKKIIEGIESVFAGKESVVTPEQVKRVMTQWQAQVMEMKQAETIKTEASRESENSAFLEKNGKEPGVVTTPSGLQYKVLTDASGAKPTAEDLVKVHYSGRLLDGTVFDSSVDRGEPAIFPVNAVVPGFAEALKLMSPGAKYLVYIPSELAYGSRAMGPIAANSLLVFEIELLEINPQQ